MNNQILEVVRIMKLTALKDLQDLAGINVGSFHKGKDEIVNNVCDRAREARAFQEFMLMCIAHICEGGSIETYIHSRIEEITESSSLCIPDQLRLREMLNRLSENAIQID